MCILGPRHSVAAYPRAPRWCYSSHCFRNPIKGRRRLDGHQSLSAVAMGLWVILRGLVLDYLRQSHTKPV